VEGNIAQYIIRNVFNIKKVKFVEKTQKVIYQGRMKKGKNRKNFEVYSALEFIAAITQHIPNKFSQLSRYFGFNSNKSRGLRAKAEQLEHTQDTAVENNREDINIIDVSQYQPKKVPSLTWCECIKKIWKDDPLVCPECMGLMKIISFITEGPIIHKHLGLWEDETARDPPPKMAPHGDCVDTLRRCQRQRVFFTLMENIWMGSTRSTGYCRKISGVMSVIAKSG
jgi:putative transposase